MNGTFMSIRLGIVMDPIAFIRPHKDSSFAMLLAAQARGWQLHYMQQADLFLAGGQACAGMRAITVRDQPHDWFTLGGREDRPLADLDVILMRKDPPFDMEYIYTTYLLEQAEHQGVLVVNRPQALRDANEKLSTAWFPQCCPATLVSRDRERIRAFLEAQGDIILKPLDGMGGASIFRLGPGDGNTSVIMETLTAHGTRFCMAQRYIPEIRAGDKRILLIDGEPVDLALARIPAAGEVRGNLAAGGSSKAQALSEHDHWICAQVGPMLREKGLVFVGLDVIGDFLTEINVTSPTCIRELDQAGDLDIAGRLLDAIEQRLRA